MCDSADEAMDLLRDINVGISLTLLTACVYINLKLLMF